jgi:hypothetical protein
VLDAAVDRFEPTGVETGCGEKLLAAVMSSLDRLDESPHDGDGHGYLPIFFDVPCQRNARGLHGGEDADAPTREKTFGAGSA